MDRNEIGDFLRARREQIRPEDLGLLTNGHRRVAGLRRDEVAMLAGISTEYYTRLEQGRDRRPSVQVLDAIARAMGLSSDAADHLHRLGEPKQVRRSPRRAERVRPGVVALLDSWHDSPAYVEGRYLDVLAANSLALAVSPLFRPGTNLLRAMLLESPDPAAAPNLEASVAHLTALLRDASAADLDAPRLTELVGELSVKSDLFRRLWSRHEVRPHPGHGVTRFNNPQVGGLDLTFEKFAVTGSAGQQMVIMRAAPGTASAERLAMLASWGGSTRPDTTTVSPHPAADELH